MIGAIVGAGLKSAGSIFGGIKASQAMKKVQDNLNQQLKENQDLYDRRYNEDATQRADAQRLLTMTERSIKERNRQAAGAAAVGGGTEESVAAAKAANNQALVDATGQIAAQGDARKDAIEQRFLDTKAGLNGQLNDMERKRAGAISQAVQGVGDVAGNIVGAF